MKLLGQVLKELKDPKIQSYVIGQVVDPIMRYVLGAVAPYFVILVLLLMTIMSLLLWQVLRT
jgi:hypothetical protein